MNNFYILGTKYGEKNNQDVSQYLQKRGVVSIGFSWLNDLSKFYNGNFAELEKLLAENGEKPHTISQVKKFLSLAFCQKWMIKKKKNPIVAIELSKLKE